MHLAGETARRRDGETDALAAGGAERGALQHAVAGRGRRDVGDASLRALPRREAFPLLPRHEEEAGPKRKPDREEHDAGNGCTEWPRLRTPTQSVSRQLPSATAPPSIDNRHSAIRQSAILNRHSAIGSVRPT